MKMSEKQVVQHETWRIYKNVVMIGAAFMVHFTAYHGAADLQSSINAEAGLGTASLAAIYVGLIISSIFVPAALIKWVGTKWAMCLSFMTYWPYIIAQLYPRFYTMIPTALVMGFGSAPVWCCMGIYLATLAEVYSEISNISSEVLLMRFSGIFYAIYTSSAVFGNLISSLVLSSGHNEAAGTVLNASLVPELCGANFLPITDSAKALVPQPPEKIRMLVAIYVGCMAAAVVVISVSVDSMKRYVSDRSPSTSLSGVALLTVTVKLLKEPNQLLIILISMYVGMQNVFFTATVTAAYVSCSVGAGSVGFIMMAHGTTGVLASSFIAYVVKIIHRFYLMAFSAVMFVVLLIFLLLWKPQVDTAYVLYIVAACWGLCDYSFLVLTNAYNGILFPNQKEAAFSNFRLWKSVGYVIAYTTTHYLRARTKIYLTLGTLIIGSLCYSVTEHRERLRKRSEKEKMIVSKGHVNIGFKNEE